MSDIVWLTAAELSAAFASQTLSPVEAARAVLDRIAAVDHAINAFCHLDPETTLAEAAASERRWSAGAPLSPVDGVTAGATARRPACPRRSTPRPATSDSAACCGPPADGRQPCGSTGMQYWPSSCSRAHRTSASASPGIGPASSW